MPNSTILSFRVLPPGSSTDFVGSSRRQIKLRPQYGSVKQRELATALRCCCEAWPWCRLAWESHHDIETIARRSASDSQPGGTRTWSARLLSLLLAVVCRNPARRRQAACRRSSPMRRSRRLRSRRFRRSRSMPSCESSANTSTTTPRRSPAKRTTKRGSATTTTRWRRRRARRGRSGTASRARSRGA